MKRLIAIGALAGGIIIGTGGVASAHRITVTTPGGTVVVDRGLHPAGVAAHEAGLPTANCALDGTPAAMDLGGPSDC